MPSLKSLASPVADILYGNPKFWKFSKPKATHMFCSVCDFMMGLGKPKLYTKFEVANFSHGVNIEGELPNFWELPQSTFGTLQLATETHDSCVRVDRWNIFNWLQQPGKE